MIEHIFSHVKRTRQGGDFTAEDAEIAEDRAGDERWSGKKG
jgi:hypothetical protein